MPRAEPRSPPGRRPPPSRPSRRPRAAARTQSATPKLTVFVSTTVTGIGASRAAISAEATTPGDARVEVDGDDALRAPRGRPLVGAANSAGFGCDVVATRTGAQAARRTSRARTCRSSNGSPSSVTGTGHDLDPQARRGGQRRAASSSRCRSRRGSPFELEIVGMAEPERACEPRGDDEHRRRVREGQRPVGGGPQEFGSLRRHQTTLAASQTLDDTAVETSAGCRRPGTRATPDRRRRCRAAPRPGTCTGTGRSSSRLPCRPGSRSRAGSSGRRPPRRRRRARRRLPPSRARRRSRRSPLPTSATITARPAVIPRRRRRSRRPGCGCRSAEVDTPAGGDARGDVGRRYGAEEIPEAAGRRPRRTIRIEVDICTHAGSRAVAGTTGFGLLLWALVVRGSLTLDLGIGRRLRPLGPLRLGIAAPREVVFDVIAAPYLGRTPRALRVKLEVLERGEDLVLAAHHTPAYGLTRDHARDGPLRAARARALPARARPGPARRRALRAPRDRGRDRARVHRRARHRPLGSRRSSVGRRGRADAGRRPSESSLDGIKAEAQRRAKPALRVRLPR